MQNVLADQICHTGCVFVFSEKKFLGSTTKLPSNKQQPSSHSH